jgi:hypothetical protein
MRYPSGLLGRLAIVEIRDESKGKTEANRPRRVFYARRREKIARVLPSVVQRRQLLAAGCDTAPGRRRKLSKLYGVLGA